MHFALHHSTSIFPPRTLPSTKKVHFTPHAIRSNKILQHRIPTRQCPTPLLSRFSSISMRNSSRPPTRLSASVDEASPGFLESIQTEQRLESTKLGSETRSKVMGAVEELGCRVTVGDVAGRAGVTLFEAEEALKALAADSQGTLEVSGEGEVVYVLQRDFRNVIRSKSLSMRMEPTLQWMKKAGGIVLRTAFGVGFLVTVISVWLAIAVISSSDDGNGNRRRSPATNMNMSFDILNAVRMWMYFGPRRMSDPEELGFFQSVYSVVFGDGDPNSGFEERRWFLIGRYIQSRGGVVAAEELAPYLDPPKLSEAERNASDDGMGYPDEGFMLSVLVRFGGEAKVDETGNLLYVFPKLQQSGSKARAVAPVERYVQEEQWELTKASKLNQVLVGLLAVANVVGVGVLQNAVMTSPEFAPALPTIFPGLLALQVYAWAFVVIPAVRWLLNKVRNGQIEERNEAREWSAVNVQRPNLELKRKLKQARLLSERRVLTDKDIVFSSEQDSQTYEQREFDQRLSELETSN